MGPTIDIAVEHPAWSDALGDAIDPLVKRAVGAALAGAGPAGSVAQGAELSLVLCDDGFIRDLNRRWRGKDKATNVLSFPAAGVARQHALGDIVVAYETSAAEAATHGTPLADYLAHLVVHGTFHLLGFDHEEEAEADRMEQLEARVLATLGVASPFQPSDACRTDHREAP